MFDGPSANREKRKRKTKVDDRSLPVVGRITYFGYSTLVNLLPRYTVSQIFG